MTFRPERSVRLWFLLLALTVVVPPLANWLHANCQLPAGYGAEGDRRRAIPIPGPVRSALESLPAGGEGVWVKECVEGGAWVYEFHLGKGGKSSVVRISPLGKVIPPAAPDPEPETGGEAPTNG